MQSLANPGHTAAATPSAPLVVSLYISQYLGIGFLYYGLNSILRESGVELEQLAAVQLIGLLWVFKALWSPLVDHFTLGPGGHYRSWLLVLQPLLAVVTLALIPFTNPAEQLTPVLALFAVFIGVSATQDIATDAIVTRYVPPHRQGFANGAATVGSWLGNVLGGGAILIMYDRFGWSVAIITLAVLVALPLPWVLRFAEPQMGNAADDAPAAETAVPPDATTAAADPSPANTPAVPAATAHADPTARAAQAPSLESRYANLGSLFRLPGRARWSFGVLPLFWSGAVGAYGLIAPAAVDAGWSVSMIGLGLGMITAIPGTLGAICAGWILTRFGLASGLLVSGIGVAVTTPGLWWLFTSGGLVVSLALICGYVFCMAAASTMIYRAHVGLSRDDYAGSDFTTLTSVGILWTVSVGYFLFTVAHYAGYVAASAVSIVLVLVGSGLAFRFARTQEWSK